MNVACPQCAAVYRIDPGKVPDDGATARCASCGTAFRVDGGTDTAPGEIAVGARPRPMGRGPEQGPPADRRSAGAGQATGGGSVGGGTGEGSAETDGGGDRPVFGPQDPGTRARRLARALVSDIKVYNRERWRASLEAGTLRGDLRDEILKSWEEYVEQVGEEMAKKTPYFRDALNDVLAEGRRVF